MSADDLMLARDCAALQSLDRQARVPAIGVLCVGVLVMAALFRQEIAAAVQVWLSSTAFGHCFLVGPIAVWLACERRGALAGLTPRPVPALALLALPLAAVWFVAERLAIMEARQFAALVLVWLLVAATCGFTISRAMAVPLGYTVFLVPFGAFLVPALQDFTARFIDVGLSILAIPHFVTATLIEIPEGNFRVAEACAGLRFLIAAIAFGTLYACVIYRSAWRRIAFILVCIVVPILANGVRALGIVLLGHIKGSAEAGAVDHVLYGWIFFSLVILLLLLLGLPFRQDVEVTADRPGTAAAAGSRRRVSAYAIAAAAVVACAAAGPAGAAILDERGRAASAAVSAEAERLTAALAVPPGCVAGPAQDGRRDFVCDGIRLGSRVLVFAGRSGPAALRAWRDAADPVPAEDAETTWQDGSRAHWRIVRTHQPDRMFAAALWLDGAPAPDGIALRLRLARDTVTNGDRLVVLAEFSAPGADLASAAALASLMQAQIGFPAPAD